MGYLDFHWTTGGDDGSIQHVRRLDEGGFGEVHEVSRIALDCMLMFADV
jgi:hypothetical protein